MVKQSMEKGQPYDMVLMDIMVRTDHLPTGTCGPSDLAFQSDATYGRDPKQSAHQTAWLCGSHYCMHRL